MSPRSVSGRPGISIVRRVKAASVGRSSVRYGEIGEAPATIGRLFRAADATRVPLGAPARRPSTRLCSARGRIGSRPTTRCRLRPMRSANVKATRAAAKKERRLPKGAIASERHEEHSGPAQLVRVDSKPLLVQSQAVGGDGADALARQLRADPQIALGPAGGRHEGAEIGVARPGQEALGAVESRGERRPARPRGGGQGQLEPEHHDQRGERRQGREPHQRTAGPRPGRQAIEPLPRQEAERQAGRQAPSRGGPEEREPRQPTPEREPRDVRPQAQQEGRQDEDRQHADPRSRGETRGGSSRAPGRAGPGPRTPDAPRATCGTGPTPAAARAAIRGRGRAPRS